MKRIVPFILVLFLSFNVWSQSAEEAKKLLDEVSTKMTALTAMQISFSSSLVNEEAGIGENDEPPIKGDITIQGDKYNLNYLGNTFIFDGKKLYVINHDEQEVSVNDGDMEDEGDGFIYPSKIFTFYKEGYNFEMGKLTSTKGKKVQFVTLSPIDSNSEVTKVELGVFTKSKEIYQMKQTGANGAVTTLTIKQFKGNPELPKSTFTFDRVKYQDLNYLID